MLKISPRLIEHLSVWWDQRSLQSRLIVAYIAIILVPSLLVSIVSFNAINKTYISDTIDKSESLLNMEKLHIQNQIESMERSAQLARSDKEVVNYLTRDEDPPLKELVDFNMNAYVNLTRIQFNNPNIENLHLFTDNPYVYEIWPIIFSEQRIKQEPWYSATYGLGDQQMWYFQNHSLDLTKLNVANPETKIPKVSLLQEISVIAGEHSGIIQVDMLLSDFAPRTFSVQEERSQMFLIDHAGQIFTRGEQSLLSDNPQMKKAIAERIGLMDAGGFWQTEYKEGGKTYLFHSIPLEGLDAYLLNVISMEDVLRQISKIRNQTIGANVLFILIFTIIAYIMNSFILKNLVSLTDAMKKARRGELYTGVVIRGGGEIGELAYHFNKLMNKINELVAIAVRKEALSKEAELRTLHNQIDSHFLYNTLENIRMLAEMEDQRKIADALTSLGGMMRYNFKWSGDYVKLKDELRHIRNYIEVMNIRFDTPIKLILDIPEYVLEAEVLKMSLQPLIENSVKHAWADLTEEPDDKRIRIQAETSGEIFQLKIIDNGSGMDVCKLQEITEKMLFSQSQEEERRKHTAAGGIGLTNVHQRMKLFYGKEYGLMVQSTEGKGIEVIMTLPKVLLTGGEAR